MTNNWGGGLFRTHPAAPWRKQMDKDVKGAQPRVESPFEVGESGGFCTWARVLLLLLRWGLTLVRSTVCARAQNTSPRGGS